MEGDISRWFRETIGIDFLPYEAMMLSSGDFEGGF